MYLENKKKSLFKNTFMLYVLMFSKYILGFITVPYETRVLGPEKYGLIGLATAIITYFQLFVDFGFLLSATEQVSKNREDKKKLSEIFTSVFISKIILLTVSVIVLSILCLLISSWREHMLFFIVFLFATIMSSLLPDYLYRGMEEMTAITVRTVCVQVFFTLMIFIFVKTPQDYMVYPIIKLIGNTVALLFVFLHLKKTYHIKLIRVKIKKVFLSLKSSAMFFLSRIATTIYTTTNTIILDFMSAGGMTGYYTSAERLVTTANGMLSPISDSLYPYMLKHKDFKMVKKMLLILEPIIIIGCSIVFIWARPLCTWFFGEEYYYTADVLRALIPSIVITLPVYIFGFPVLGAMGLNKHANYSVMLSSMAHIVCILILFSINKINVVTLGLSSSFTQYVVFIYRIIIVYKNRKMLNLEKKE